MSGDERMSCSSPSHSHKAVTPRGSQSSRDARQSMTSADESPVSAGHDSILASRLTSAQPSPKKDAQGWEIIEGLRSGQPDVHKPERHEGFLLKKRKWPLKGWHKRFFVLENGIVKYAKSPAEVQRGKLHGSIDIGLSVMSIKKKSRRIDLDTEEYIYHLKIKSQEMFDVWVSKLRNHRLFRQNEIACSPGTGSRHLLSPLDVCPGQHFADGKMSRSSSSPGLSGSLSNGQIKMTSWLLDTDEMDHCARGLNDCQANLAQLSGILKSLEILQRTQSAPSFSDMQGACLENGKKEKRSARRWRTKSVSKDSKMHLQLPNSPSASPIRLHASNPNLSMDGGAGLGPGLGVAGLGVGPGVGPGVGLGAAGLVEVGVESPVRLLSCSKARVSIAESLDGCSTDYSRLQEEFCCVAKKVHVTLKSVFNSLAIEKEKLRQVACEHEAAGAGHAAHVLALKKALAQPPEPPQEGPLVPVPLSESRLSVSESVSEFFDAQEVLISASSSENEPSDDESYVSDVSDNVSEDNISVTDGAPQTSLSTREGGFRNGRRSFLPAPCPDTSGVSLWNILRNNIGKDLAKVSMPVELNEPLNTLQRLCEELEYSELLEQASDTEDPAQRMVLTAAFAVSAYAPTYYRSGNKPFNPVLGETYECIREDKGFRFVAEQVSHHPPISACHCESKTFVLWQDVRWKNKFWGKSMEILPLGTVSLNLPKYGDLYEWNKVTSCIHNILNGPRWIEHYGEITIRNRRSGGCSCKLTFVKGNYWNSNVNEVQGAVMDADGKVLHRLFGKWHEGLYCGVPPSAKCIWRPGSMPNDYQLYYGFTRFAIELNELDPAMAAVLPPTDTRFRPDQRLLEEGNVEAASEEKRRVEETQRERRRNLEEMHLQHQPRFFRRVVDSSGRECWVTNGIYWELRRESGFAKLESQILW
ncbi:oxysterol-binding protein-related protein 6-like isoform X2 [Lethenteron reissneri]|uniref:oxysterol-binding protein-related protein 6-like isoform X2 n=1 Tax=Lethenteron reissneri TaxID=7753 RepID=UPI002AB72214|nr:oxysterol-binding protein-related protein 6-like isoform X2 [Lethenteron reissneri]